MAIDQAEFDKACAEFTEHMRCVADWKINFMGAAYSTRLLAALLYAEAAIDEIKAVLSKDTQ